MQKIKGELLIKGTIRVKAKEERKNGACYE